MKAGRSWRGRCAATGAVVAALVAMAPHSAGAQGKLSDKWVTVVMPAEPADLDGCQSSRAIQGRVVKQNIFETLIEKNPSDGALKPRLAVSWEPVDPTTWRIKLRDGVVFHDGSPLTAAAVKRSLDRTVSNKFACGDQSKFFAGVSMNITAVDTLTLLIKTPDPEPILPVRLAGAEIVGPNTALDKLIVDPVGTGPYVLESWQNGQQILLKRNEKYWGAKPEVEGVRYIWRAESAVRAAMVNIGEADIGHSIAEEDAKDPKIDHSFLNSETAFLRLDTEIPPLNDRRVRLALNYALDLDSIPGSILPKGVIRATQIVYPPIPGHNHDLDKNRRPYDPAKARQLLAEAKSDGVPVDTEMLFISYPASFPNAQEVMEALFSMYRAVGLNMKLRAVEPGQYQEYQTKPFKEGRPPIIFQSSHDNAYGDPVFSVIGKYGCKSHSSTLCDPALDKEVARVSGLSGEDRVAGWQGIFHTLYEDIVPDVMLYHLVGFIRVSPRIDFVPDVTSNSEIRIQEIHFTKK